MEGETRLYGSARREDGGQGEGGERGGCNSVSWAGDQGRGGRVPRHRRHENFR